ncbi:MAG TPA: stalk domain-containing protein [Pyrinomonadaceae bacterium]|nr:stalk domain-containing protein [Pyrinomonadaceae bacterium]
MDIPKFLRAAIAVCLACALSFTASAGLVVRAATLRASDEKESERPSNESPPAAPDTIGTAAPGQPQQTTIIVDGRTLTGPQSLPQQRGGRLFLPVTSIARALGDVVTVDATARTIVVRRQTGTAAEFNAQLNQVSENNSLVLSTSSTADIVFPPNADALMLPVEIVSALLDVAVSLDEAARAVRVTRGRARAETVRAGARQSAFELYQVDYDYNLNRYSTSSNQSLTLNADGRIGDGRFHLTTNSSVGTGRPFGLMRNVTLTYDRPNGQRFVAGDFGTGTDLLFMSSTVRGVSAQLPVRGVRLTAFAGRAASGDSRPRTPFPFIPDDGQPEAIQQSRLRYDTNVFGAYATFGPSVGASYRPDQLLFSAGAISFNGPGRSGQMLTGSARYASERARFQGDVAAGRFRGTRGDGSLADGTALAADLSASYDLSDQLTVQGRYTHVGANFLGPQMGLHEPVKVASAGVTWRPRQWLTASVTGNYSARPNTTGQRERFVATTINITPRGPWPTIFFTHTQSGATQSGSGAYTLLNVAKDFSRWRLFLNATRVKTLGPAFLNAQVGANLRVGESHTLQLSQSFGSRGTLSGAADWDVRSFFSKRLSLGAGFSYHRAEGTPFTTAERLFVSARLPRQSTLQLTYLQGQSGPQVLLSLRGPLLRARRAEAAASVPISELDSYGAYYGRVYQDVNLDGRYDAGVDKPQANVKVRVDGSRYVVSDEEGRYRIDDVRVGEHQIHLDLLSVRADLTLLDEAQQVATLQKGRDVIVDFRLVRTGRIAGVVWLDANGNNQLDEGEQPLADVRVVTGSGRDTLTDENGVFLIGDLPPGEHAVLIDEKTLPEKTVSAAGTLSVKVLAGSETGGVNFHITPAPPEVKRFPSAGN